MWPTSMNNVDTWEKLLTFQRRTLRAMDEHLRTASGLSLNDYDVLHQLSRSKGPSRMGDLADRLLVANSSCHRIVSRLVDLGYVGYTVGAEDARTRLVDLTTDGRRVHRRLAVIHGKDIVEMFVDKLDPDEQAVLAQIVSHLAY